MSRIEFPHGTKLSEAVAALSHDTTVEEIRNSASRTRQASSRDNDIAKLLVSSKPVDAERISAALVTGGLSR
jgi:uncharacterized pyridoxal phosphate-containing UPF0001 family protein